jgi:hypothetical protein
MFYHSKKSTRPSVLALAADDNDVSAAVAAADSWLDMPEDF